MSTFAKHVMGVLLVLLFVVGATIAPAGDEVPAASAGLAELPGDEVARVAAASVADLGWLGGCWGATEGTRETIECWLPPLGGVMLAINRDGSPRGAFFEYLRIASVEGVVTYLASPLGRTPTPFSLVALGEERAVFENLAHDFPQRITYRRRGDALDVQIEGVADGAVKSSQWTWQAVPFPGDRTTR